MIPRLLESVYRYDDGQDKTVFDISHNGIGFLPDCISCEVQETLNKSYTLNATYPIGGRNWNKIRRGLVIVAIPDEFTNEQAFLIKTVRKRDKGTLDIDAEHISYNASGIMVTGFNAGNSFLFRNNLLSHAVNNDFSFETDIQKSRKILEMHKAPRTMRSYLLDDTEPSFLSLYGGEFEFDNMSIYAHQSRGKDRGVVFRYGTNITGMTLTETIRDFPTGVYPFWIAADASGAQAPTTLPEKVVWFGAADFVDIQKAVPLDLSDRFETQPTEEQIRIAVDEWMQENVKDQPPFSLSISVLELPKTIEYSHLPSQRVGMGDIVTVDAPEFYDQPVKVKVVKTVFDVLMERYTKIDVGDVLPDLSTAILKLTGVIR